MSAIDSIREKVLGKDAVPCTGRFQIQATASNINNQLFAGAQISGGSEISGATLYLVHAGAADDDPRFSSANIGPVMGQKTTFKLPLSLAVSISPFEKSQATDIIIFVAISTPGSDKMCYLQSEQSVH
jgi:hypothetical protein